MADINQTQSRDTLKPIRKSKPATAEKALQRPGISSATPPLLAMLSIYKQQQKQSLFLVLRPSRLRISPSLPWQDMSGFNASLSAGSVTHLALRLLILTGLWTAPIRPTQAEHVDDDVIIVPADLMKARKGDAKPFRILLTAEGIGVIKRVKRHARDGSLFPSPRKGTLSDMTISRQSWASGCVRRATGPIDQTPT